MKSFTTVWVLLLAGHVISAQTSAIKIVEERKIAFNIDSLIPGIPAFHSTKLNYSQGGKPRLGIFFSEPKLISVADKPEKWGYFQFPEINRMADRSIHIRWKLNEDAMEAYGNHQAGEAISRDGGKTFKLSKEKQDPFTELILPNGDRINIHTPKPLPATDLNLPPAIGGSVDTYSKSRTEYFRLADLPQNAQLIYFDRLPNKSFSWIKESATLKDPQAARYTLRGYMPIIWWGDLHIAKDKSIVAGVYPGFFVKEDGKADSFHHVFFYRSTDNAQSWAIQGRVFYTPDLAVDTKGNQRMGFTEPGYEVLPSGRMIAVMRTTDGIGNGPMYRSYSDDNGVSWSKAAVFTPSGVLPQLLQLENGVLVMSSGRPGVQLRFSYDGKGETWTNPFEMMPWIDYKDQVSCGYTSLLATGHDRFMIVYSDFRHVTPEGVIRKSIKVREVIVQPQK